MRNNYDLLMLIVEIVLSAINLSNLLVGSVDNMVGGQI